MNAAKLIAVLAGFPVVVFAAPVDERIDAAPDGEVEVRNVSGDIVISAWDESAVHVTGDISDDAERLDVRREGDRVVVEVIYPEDWRGSDNLGDDTDLVIRAPRGSSLDVETVSADLAVSGIEGEQYLKSVSGDVVAETFTAEVRVQSVSGDVQVTGRDDATRTSASAVSGDVRFNRVSGEIDVESVSGDVEVASGLIERAELQSVSGDVSLQGELAADARVRANSTSGDVELLFRGDGAAEYSLTSFSGEIANCFGPTAARSRQGPSGSALRFTEGSSSASVEITTMSGDIGLCR
jgi:DUF4097 and DUF4098 domain-containing protein YvlB